jgi:hypothetical protein
VSYQDGLAAINLEMPTRVPRTEYSADTHWALVSAVTGIEVDASSPAELKSRARVAFRRAWNYDFNWEILGLSQVFGDMRTKMGHAVYASGGVDFSPEVVCPFKEPEEVLRFDPWEAYGQQDRRKLTRDFENHYRKVCDYDPDVVNTTGIYVTCVSGLIEIFGWEMLLLTVGLDPEGFGEVANRYASWIQQYFDALGDANVPVVMVHDDIAWTSGPVFHPEWYRKYVFPNYRRFFGPLIDSGKKILYTSDGTYTEFIDDIAATGVHGFVMEPTTDMKYVAERYGKTHVFMGNADTRVLLNGTKEDIYAEVKRCMDIGKGCPGFFMAVGNHIPSNTPVENAVYYNDVYEELSRR